MEAKTNGQNFPQLSIIKRSTLFQWITVVMDRSATVNHDHL